uniref:Uncharacterized protein n=1 Tax=viral metagenome TaxID=1070528 RepID=A0A6C0ES58_9ZZZZ
MTNSRKKSHKSRKPLKILHNIRVTTKKALPVVASGLKSVGKTAKIVAQKSAPIVEEGVSTVYGALATGFDMGIKGAKGIAKRVSKKRRVHNNKSHKKRHRKH